MADVPCILDGKFFSITSTRDGKVIAKCTNCINKSISGTSVATSNFVRHLKVTNGYFSYLHTTGCVGCID